MESPHKPLRNPGSLPNECVTLKLLRFSSNGLGLFAERTSQLTLVLLAGVAPNMALTLSATFLVALLVELALNPA